MPNVGASVASEIDVLTCSGEMARAFATLAACMSALAGLICGSRPEADPVTASAGIGALGVNTRGVLSLFRALIAFTSWRSPFASLNWPGGIDDSYATSFPTQ